MFTNPFRLLKSNNVNLLYLLVKSLGSPLIMSAKFQMISCCIVATLESVNHESCYEGLQPLISNEST